MITQQERDEIVFDVLEAITSGSLRVVGADDNTVWEKGWGEILENIRCNGFSPELLKPQYFNEDKICRMNGDYARCEDAWEYDQQLRRNVFKTHMSDSKRIVELGCGTGANLLQLAEVAPDAELIACDWARASQEIVAEIAKYLGRDIRAESLNMLTLQGWDRLGIDEGATVLTVHALEQLGGDWGLLLTALRKARPLCVHIEPILELYDETQLFDCVAADYHRARNYLSGWLPAIQELEQRGEAKIIRCERLGFGNRYHEAYSVLVWQPL